jgi:hypothetical protein
MHSTVAWLKTNGFKYLKIDSGGCYNDQQLWHDLIQASGQDMVIENCHQVSHMPRAILSLADNTITVAGRAAAECNVVPVRLVEGRGRCEWDGS